MSQDNQRDNQDVPYVATSAAPENQLDNQFGLYPPIVPDYLIWSILLTCWCPPLGIIAIVYSAVANSAKQEGDFQTALDHAQKAKLFVLLGIALGFVLYVLGFLLTALAIFVPGPGTGLPPGRCC